MQVPAQKGIAVRCVLFDWAGWMDSQNKTINAFSPTSITTHGIDAVAAWQGLSDNWSSPGYMLIIRTGWVRQYNTLNETSDVLLPIGAGNWIGMETSEASLRWLWEKKLSLVGADNPVFESVSAYTHYYRYSPLTMVWRLLPTRRSTVQPVRFIKSSLEGGDRISSTF
jgi:kynurenine formamidase